MKAIKTKLKTIQFPFPLRRGGVGLLLVGLGWVFLFTSCANKSTSLANVAEEDSLFIDTVATLDEKLPTDTVAIDSTIVTDI